MANECARCGWPYPSDLLNAMTTGFGTSVVCGICALEIANAVHGTRMTKFHGSGAERMRQRAIQWRANHPASAPEGAQEPPR